MSSIYVQIFWWKLSKFSQNRRLNYNKEWDFHPINILLPALYYYVGFYSLKVDWITTPYKFSSCNWKIYILQTYVNLLSNPAVVSWILCLSIQHFGSMRLTRMSYINKPTPSLNWKSLKIEKLLFFFFQKQINQIKALVTLMF